jgi:hypothetical protein
MSPEFPNLSSRWKTLNPTGVKASNYNPTLTPPPCPAFTSNVWQVEEKAKLPALGQTYQAEHKGSTTGSAGSESSAEPTGQSGANATPSDKGAAPAVSAWGLQTVALGFVAMVAGLCIWL